MKSPNEISRPKPQKRSQSLKWMTLLFLALAASAWWSSGKAATEEENSRRTWQNLTSVGLAVRRIKSIVPPMLHEDGSQKVNVLIDAAIHAAGANERSLRSRSIRPLGAVADLGVFRTQAHLEFGGLTQAQAGGLVNAFDQTALPIRIASADLTAAAADRWDLIIDLEWLESSAGQLASLNRP